MQKVLAGIPHFLFRFRAYILFAHTSTDGQSSPLNNYCKQPTKTMMQSPF
jgi:hypothetical protein